MKLFPAAFVLLFIFSAFQHTSIQTDNDKKILAELLDDFLAGASVNDAEMHDRFWAEDLIYTGSAGTRTTKSEIMDGLNNQAVNESEDSPSYQAEDLQIQLYGDTAVVAFRLVALFHAADEEDKQFYNTGTFLKRDGQWKAVAWQATRIPD